MYAPRYFAPRYFAPRYYHPSGVPTTPPVATSGVGQEYSLPFSVLHFDVPESEVKFSKPYVQQDFSLPTSLLHFSVAGLIQFTLDEED